MKNEKMKKIKNIAVLTSGGDCPALNSALRAIVNRAHYKYGWKVYGIKNGVKGFFQKDPQYKILHPRDFNFYESRISGSILGCMNKGESPFTYPLFSKGRLILPAGKKDLTGQFKESIKKLGIDGIIVVGGDGSMNIMYHLCQKVDVNMIGIPKTIDNDTPLTEISIGYPSVLDTCVSAIDSLITTAKSHQRWMILEVMGRNAGHIAIGSGVAGGADVILIPEINFKIKNIIKKIKSVKKEEGRDFGIIVVAEGTSSKEFKKSKNKTISDFLAKKLEESGIEARAIVLGHIQRGGRPNAYDRLLATSFGTRAVDSLAQGDQYKMLAYNKTGFIKVDLKKVADSITENVNLKSNKIKTAIDMGVYIGD